MLALVSSPLLFYIPLPALAVDPSVALVLDRGEIQQTAVPSFATYAEGSGLAMQHPGDPDGLDVALQDLTPSLSGALLALSSAPSLGKTLAQAPRPTSPQATVTLLAGAALIARVDEEAPQLDPGTEAQRAARRKLGAWEFELERLREGTDPAAGKSQSDIWQRPLSSDYPLLYYDRYFGDPLTDNEGLISANPFDPNTQWQQWQQWEWAHGGTGTLGSVGIPDGTAVMSSDDGENPGAVDPESGGGDGAVTPTTFPDPFVTALASWRRDPTDVPDADSPEGQAVLAGIEARLESGRATPAAAEVLAGLRDEILNLGGDVPAAVVKLGLSSGQLMPEDRRGLVVVAIGRIQSRPGRPLGLGVGAAEVRQELAQLGLTYTTRQALAGDLAAVVESGGLARRGGKGYVLYGLPGVVRTQADIRQAAILIAVGDIQSRKDPRAVDKGVRSGELVAELERRGVEITSDETLARDLAALSESGDLLTDGVLAHTVYSVSPGFRTKTDVNRSLIIVAVERIQALPGRPSGLGVTRAEIAQALGARGRSISYRTLEYALRRLVSAGSLDSAGFTYGTVYGMPGTSLRTERELHQDVIIEVLAASALPLSTGEILAQVTARYPSWNEETLIADIRELALTGHITSIERGLYTKHDPR